MRGRKVAAPALLISLLVGAVAAAAGCGVSVAVGPSRAAVIEVTTTGADSNESAPGVSFIGREGAKSFTLSELKAMPATQGYGGYICPPNPGITGPTQYEGVPLADVLAEVGGLAPDSVVSVAATDGYVMTFTSEQILKGTLVTYDPATGKEAKVEQAPQVVLAYQCQGRPLGKKEGPLRLVFLTPKPEQVVEGFLWVKWVSRIQVRSESDDWILRLDGPSQVSLDRRAFADLEARNGNKATWEDIQGRTWSGVPLSVLVAAAISGGVAQAGASGQESPQKAYSVEITGADGHTVTLDGADVAGNPGYVVANEMEGIPLGDEEFPLSLVGSSVASGKYLTDAKLFVPGISKIRVFPKEK